MGNLIFDCIKHKGKDALQSEFSSVLDIPCSRLGEGGEPAQPLSIHVGEKKAYLFVNVATK